MRTIKGPKEPKTFKWPRLYMRFVSAGQSSDDIENRIRIIYPDRHMPPEYIDNDRYIFCDRWFEPCWYDGGFLTPKQQVLAMKKYDKYFGYKTTFICEIK